MKSVILLIAPLCLYAQALRIEVHERKIPAWVEQKLSASDKVLFGKLTRAGIETMWAEVMRLGYPICFINELNPLHPNRRMVGRARTIRYLPNRKDLREKLYSAGPQLNFKSSEEAEPGDILVFDAGGEIKSAVTGGITTARFLYRGGAGIVVDGALRDIPEFEAMPIQVYLRRGHAAAVSPVMMSVDYQVPVNIGGVTVIPGDILVGETHGILVIPAAIVEEVVDKALEHDLREEWQREMLLKGESITTVYPWKESNRPRFEEWKKARARQ
jgi:regulator of RNase E activity RraA